MASASIYIQERPYKDGNVPIFLRIILHRKVYLKQLAKVPEEYVDRKRKEVRQKHRQSYQVNRLILNELDEAKKYLLDCQLKKINPDPERFFKGGKVGSSLIENIMARADRFESEQQFGTAAKQRSTARRIEKLKLDTSVEMISHTWIKKLDAGLRGLGNKPVTVRKHMAVISAVLNDLEGVSNPFETYTKPNNESTTEKMNRKELEAFQAVHVDDAEQVARDMFIFSFMGRGIRAFDLLTMEWSNVADGRLRYATDKSKSSKVIDLKITDGMASILDKYRGQNAPYIFPVMRTEPGMYFTDKKRYKGRVNRAAWRVNVLLKSIAEKAGIKKNLHLHVARHTFAYLADQGGLPMGTIQQLLGHGKLGTTQNYVESLRRSDELDDAVEGLF